MDIFDAIVVGAGPAGGQCARELASQGFHVLLIDRAKTFQENNYSSGGAPLSVMEEFALPDSIVGSYWNQLSIQSTQEKSIWSSDAPFGPVLDFDKLRKFLVDETFRAGGYFHFGYQYQSHTVRDKLIDVQLKDLNTQNNLLMRARILVDATGSERKVLAKHYNKNRAMAATGIEYHVQVDPSIYKTFAHTLHFFLGHHWMPQGYGWIFPMASNQLKVGVIRYFQNKKYVPYIPAYRFYLDQLLHLCGESSSNHITDQHGKTIFYTWKQKDLLSSGPVLALGDAISSINPLGCEGIRHALVSGRKAAQYIGHYLQGKSRDFNDYNRSMRSYFGRKWLYSEILMKSLFKSDRDKLIDQTVKAFGLMNNQDIMKVIFEYRFQHTLKSYLWYFMSRLKDFFK